MKRNEADRRPRRSRRDGPRYRSRGRRNTPGSFERLALAVVSLAFIAVFTLTYTYGSLGGATRSTEMQATAQGAQRDGRMVADPAITAGRVPSSERSDVSNVRQFSICHSGGGSNCVVDGDTAWINGEKIRLADIDAPETHPPRCELEAELGARATQRLAELMNAGPFEVRLADRDTDRYGRKLRVLMRHDRSLGTQLVREGLARTWEGRRRPWC